MKKLILFLFFAFFALSWQVDAQFSEGFEGTFLPTGWVKELGDAANDITQSSSQNHTSGGLYSARFSSYSSASDYNQYLFTASITVQAGVNDQISFWHRKYNTNSSETLEWGVSTTTQTSGAVSSWTAVSLSNTDWQQTTVDLSAYVGQNIYFAWHYYGNYAYYVYLDDVVSEAIPACPDPSAQTESNITKTSVDLGWTENGSATTWQIEYGTTGFAQGSGTTVTVTANPYNLSGLSAGTTYDWYVRADCDASGGSGQSSWVGPHTFSTMDDGYTCDFPLVISALPYNTSDNTSNYGDDYDNGDSPCNNYYLSGDDVVYSYTPASDECVDITLSNLDDTYSGIHVLDGCPIGTANCIAFEGNSTTNDRVLSGVNLTAGTTYYIVISTWATPQSVGYTLDIDNCPTCSDPTNQSESNITSTSADLSWTENSGNTAWEIEYGLTGYTQGSGTTIAVSANPYTLNGLTASTGYDWYVRSDCGSGTYSNWVGPHNFTTLGTPPANDDCDGAYVVTVNSDLNCGSTTSGTVENATQSPEDASACSGTEDDDVWFKFVATATEHKIELLNAAGSTTDLYHSVWEGTCPGGLTLVPGTCSDPNSQTVSGLTIGNTYYIRVYTWTSTGGQNTTFDVCVGTPPQPPANDDCSGAIALTVGNPGDCPTNQVTTDATSATADGNTSCDAVGDNIGVWYSFVAPASGEVVVNYTAGTATGDPGIVVYDACGGSEVPGTCQNNPATLSNITGLTGGTTYYMLLWFDGTSAAGSFDICLEDVGSCPKPSGQTESNITATSADLDWTENGTATTWDIEWGATGFTQGSGTMVTGITAKPYTLSGLSANTDYDWYVRADCGGGSQSIWEGPHTFTTAPPPPANDDCSSATVLNCGDNLTGETTDGASDNGDDTGCGMGKGVWYKYVASDIYELTVTATPEAGYDIELSVSTSSDCSTFTNLVCRDSGGSGSAETYTFTTTAGTTYYFYVAHYNNTSTITGDFDISLSCVTCIDPSGQTETNITATSADLDWTENGGASTWEIEWGAQGFTQGSGTTVTGISSKPYTLSGLTAQTDYDWYVRSDCGGGDFSNWTGPHTFTTLSADEVDWCNLQWPDQATITVGSSVNVYAQVYEPGVTDASGQGAGISAWIGYSTTDTDPATWTNWVVATYNVDDGNNDEYQAALGAGLTPGTYYYASRFQLNGGVYKYGGYNAGGGGFWDGTNNVSGILTIDPVVANDDCSGAYTLTVGNGACFDPVTSTNVDATDSHTYDNSIPAPGCANYSGGDLWFKVTVPASGNITIESSRTDGFTDGGIAAYSGDCSNLTLIECNDDGNSNPGTTLHSRLDLTGQTAGSTIYIRVWEYGNDNYGNFAVCAWEPMDAVVSLIGDATCEANLPVSVSHSEGNTYTWVPLVDASDNVIAYIYPYGNVLGDVIATVYRNTSGTIREDDDNIPYLDRDVEITVGGQPTGDNPRLKILYLKSEIDALIAADPAVTTIDDINFTKFETSCSGSYSGQGQPVAQTGNGTVNAANDNYIQCTVSSFSTFYGNRAGYSLPVQLATFSGYAGKDANILQWTTFSEINTAAYYVERSISGKEWSLVDKVEAAGDSYTEKDYSAVDNNPVSKAFYRLHIMDKDGRYSVSKVISIERKDSGLKLNAVYPNPNDGNFVVNLTSEPNAEGKMILVNALGVKVYTKELNVQGGRTIEKIDVSNLPTGVYTLLLEQNNNIITERVIINR